MNETKKKKRKKIRLKGLIVVIFLIYIIITAGYYFFLMPIKNVYIKGNNLVTEKEIIEIIKLNDETPVIKIHSSSLERKINKLDLVDYCEVKKSIIGNLIITIKENKVLYYDILNSKYVLSNGEKIKKGNYIGIPVLVNYVPSKIEKKLITGLQKVDSDVIAMVSEIEYNPDHFNEITLDDERFILRMNDGNTVYVNMVNIKKINKYQEIYSSISGGGTLYLDSNSKNYIFKTYSEETPEEQTDEENQDDTKKEKKEEKNES